MKSPTLPACPENTPLPADNPGAQPRSHRLAHWKFFASIASVLTASAALVAVTGGDWSIALSAIFILGAAVPAFLLAWNSYRETVQVNEIGVLLKRNGVCIKSIPWSEALVTLRPLPGVPAVPGLLSTSLTINSRSTGTQIAIADYLENFRTLRAAVLSHIGDDDYLHPFRLPGELEEASGS